MIVSFGDCGARCRCMLGTMLATCSTCSSLADPVARAANDSTSPGDPQLVINGRLMLVTVHSVKESVACVTVITVDESF